MLVTHSLQCSITPLCWCYVTLRRIELSVIYINDDKLGPEKVALQFQSLEPSHCRSGDQVQLPHLHDLAIFANGPEELCSYNGTWRKMVKVVGKESVL
jgi:hypothetical protein